MTRKLDLFSLVALGFVALALMLPLSTGDNPPDWTDDPMAFFMLMLVGTASLVTAWRAPRCPMVALSMIGLIVVAALSVAGLVNDKLAGVVSSGLWAFIFALWALIWRAIAHLSNVTTRNKKYQIFISIFVPALFGLWLLFLWEMLCVGFGVPSVLLPPPSAIFSQFFNSLDILYADFVQTFMKSVLSGFVLGCGSGFLVAILIDRSPFLKRGLLPLGNMVSALPIVGIAPIMVMWFGFDWQSKAAVVVIMTFFPMLVNTVAGLSATGKLELELMRSYGAGYWQTLFKLRLHSAMPFIFNALKINSTLALIGAIVAEFFGTPTVGMGFRISTEVGRMNVDMVWAEIFMAALAGSAFYGVMALMERAVTFWHPSYRVKHR